MSDKSNLSIYERVRSVPKEAQKTITGGRLNNMTDINPMWRIKTLTDLFGPCGTGWSYTITKREFVPGASGEVSVFTDIDLVYKDPDTGEWSLPIPGTGGSMYCVNESKGLRTDDEAPKKSLTDALSVACKALGIGADVYWDKDRTKYTQPPEEVPKKPVAPARNTPPPDDAPPWPEAPEEDPRTVSTEHVKLLLNIGKSKGYEANRVMNHAKVRYKCELKDLTMTQYGELIAGYNKLPDKIA